MADVIICLGKELHRKRHRTELEARVDKAITLYRSGQARTLLFSGGRGRRDRQTQASWMASYAVARGVPRRAIVLEERSLTTVGNAHFCNIILHERGWTSAIVVSSHHHLPRVQFVFDRILLGIEVAYEGANPPYRVRELVLEFVIEIVKLVRMRVRGIYLTKDERLATAR
jgi:uncharacterized SAM-binding protein YcdF (DUF218 family)